ncbi:DNA ligase D (plasmid) [Paracoccus versutus]|uniref:DNA ligase (ATP) n=1 Tax=Paracoccus versutus TaxID=34007 RepID=A0AAQ0HMC3_PARVE|nr:DNA ligase D [Paracoccus versutus]KGJ12413.1 DNA ligase [Paracoccus versutus]REG55787.1 bifunctional non-homologous end joining protein LigD [Paracoccus versutus]WEJ81590.1 DNA ligase D [Paracoccus versutus]
MALETYRKKRDFAATPEPKGGRIRKGGDAFVVQKHAATRLHYDFRLELDGVLKSWAVAKGPSLVPDEKRLAVHVENHPLEYGDFEGTIPKGEYGGGTVILWDRGTWTPVGDPHQGYAKGHLEFTLHGEKLHGRWHLVRMRGKPREKRENWLLIKGEDEFARTKDAPDILDERPESVKTGRQIADVAGEAPGWSSKTGRIRKPAGRAKKPRAAPEPDPEPPEPAAVKGARKAAMPGFVEPMLATLASAAPQGERWLHEIKFDGYRLQARIEAGRVKLLTRSGLDWTTRFGKAVPAALRDLPVGTAILDGELVVETDAGASDFSALQADLSAGRSDRFAFYAFDLLYLDGYDLCRVPLVERKALLARLLGQEGGILRFSTHFDEGGALVLRHACRLSLEGIVSKLRDGPYRAGRGRAWIKSKCSARQEFVVAGYVPSSVSRRAIGSLILGVYEQGGLQHVGRVGTGFSAAVAEDLFRRLERMRIPDSPFAARLTADEARQARYVRPELVAEVEFRAWTADGHLRHAAFRGLREDKPAAEIVRETAKPAAKHPAPQRRRVRLTHPDRLYWPEEGVTKEGLADYHAEVWRWIAPWITGRPLALLRCPNGIDGERFFQKHAWKGLNPHISLLRDPKEPQGEPLIGIEDLDGLMGLVQSAALEIHPWGATAADWERPDMITMDLDPGEGVAWPLVVEAARELRRRLEDHGLAGFVKTSGGKGLHVVAPLRPQAEWPAVKAFTKALADAMAADDPGRYVSTISKARRRGRILIDYLRNQRGATAVAAYSTRARPGAAVSAPLRWDELDAGIGPAWFTLQNMPTRLATLGSDPWDGFRAAAAPLEAPRSRRRKAG